MSQPSSPAAAAPAAWSAPTPNGVKEFTPNITISSVLADRAAGKPVRQTDIMAAIQSSTQAEYEANRTILHGWMRSGVAK